MDITNETVEKYGFKRINNSTWRKGNWTLQNGHTHEGVTIYEKIMNTKKAYKLCIDGKYSQMITSEELLAELVRGREVDAGISKCNKHIVSNSLPTEKCEVIETRDDFVPSQVTSCCKIIITTGCNYCSKCGKQIYWGNDC